MRAVYILPIMFVFVIFLSGCVNVEDNTTASSNRVFVGGNDALDINFYNLPSHVSKGSKFPILFEIVNKGEQDISKNDLKLTLLSASLWNVKSSTTSVDKNIMGTKLIQGKVIPGERIIYLAWNASYSSIINNTFPPDSIRVEVCYPYKTYAISDICIPNSNIYTQIAEGNKYCKPTGIKTVYNSGAPVQVTKVEQFYSSENTTTFGITIDKIKDSGKIYGGNNCNSKLNISEIKIEKISTSDPKVTSDCDGKSFDLIDGEAETLCTLKNLNTNNTYPDQLKITLSYVYKDIISKPIQIVQ